jgi:hypothetical protein
MLPIFRVSKVPGDDLKRLQVIMLVRGKAAQPPPYSHFTPESGSAYAKPVSLSNTLLRKRSTNLSLEGYLPINFTFQCKSVEVSLVGSDCSHSRFLLLTSTVQPYFRRGLARFVKEPMKFVTGMYFQVRNLIVRPTIRKIAPAVRPGFCRR